VLIAHADGEEAVAALIADPLQRAGYDVVHRGTLVVGDSLAEEASAILAEGGPLVVCGTVRAMGTGWAHRLVDAARGHPRCLVLPVRMEAGAYLESVSWGAVVAEYCQDPERAARELCAALSKRFPNDVATGARTVEADLEERYRSLLLANYDIYDLSGLPQWDQSVTASRLELRKLYVPLRVTVESSPDTELDHERLAALQFEREQQRGVWSFQTAFVETHDQRERARVAIGERLGASRRLVILGDPGSGKSTLIKWIATAYLLRLKHDPDWRDLPDVRTLPDSDWLPILVRCRELDHDQATQPFEDVIRQTVRKLGVGSEESDGTLRLLLDRLAAGRALLLIDGLDEINDPRARAAFCEQVERTHLVYPDVMILVTSRIVGYREMSRRIGRGFEHVRVAELTREDKDEFSRRWCEAMEPPARVEMAASGLIQDVHSTDRIERLTGNPLLLTTMALVRRYLGRLPNRRGDLYERAVDVLLNWRPDVGEPLTPSEALPQLEYVAHALCHRRTQQLRLDELVELCARMRAEFPNIHAAGRHDPEEFVRLVEQRTGLLTEAGYVRHEGRLVGVFEFRHLTFQEYLAGVAVARGHFPGHLSDRSVAETAASLAAPVWSPEKADEEPRMVLPENWREPIRLCVAACNSGDVDAVLEAVLTPTADEDAGLTARPRAVLAALCLADEPDASPAMADRIVRTLAGQAADRESSRSRTELDEAVAELARSRWRDLLRETLIDVYISLPSLDRAPVGAVFGRLATDSGWKVEEAAIRAGEVCRWLDDGDHVLAIEAALSVGAVAHRSDFAGSLRTSGVTARLIRRSAGSSPAADAAAWALAQIDPASAFDEWTPGTTFASPANWYLAEDELADLDRILGSGDAVSDGVLLHLYGIACHVGLRAAMGRARATAPRAAAPLRAASLLVLGALEDYPSTPLLVSQLSTDPDQQVRAAAARALGWMEDAAFAPALAAALDDASAGVRGAAANALGSVHDASFGVHLRAVLADPDASVRANAAEGLGRLGDRAQAAAIAALLGDRSTTVRRKAIWALRSLGSAPASAALAACINDEDAEVRTAAISAIGEIGDLSADEETAERVRERLSDGSAGVRRSAIEALTYAADDSLPARLLDRMRDESDSVRAAAIAALAWLGAPVADEELSAHLESDSLELVGASIDATVAADRPDVVNRLVAACDQRPSKALFMAAAGLHVFNHPPTVGRTPLEALRGVLSRHVESQDDDLSAGAVMALYVLSGGALASSVADLARSHVKDIDQHVARCVRRLTSTDLVGGLEPLARLSSPSIRWQLAYRLYQLQQQHSLPLLAVLLRDRSPVVRLWAVWTLNELPESEDVANLLFHCLHDPTSRVRRAAVWGLKDHEHNRVTTQLVRQIDDPSRQVRIAVASALGGRSPDVVLAPLLSALETPDTALRETAAWALGWTVQDPALTERFIGLLRQSDPGERAIAVSALPLRHRPELSELVVKHLDDEDSHVRSETLDALRRQRHPAAETRLRAQLGGPVPADRKNALWRLMDRREALDRQLLSIDFSGSMTRDPRWPVTMGQVRLAAWRLGVPVDEVQARYEALSDEFQLPLTWRS
jgi:HEAT repeat protein